jgi:hypothetical protein
VIGGQVDAVLRDWWARECNFYIANFRKRDFSDRCEDLRLDEAQNFSYLILFLLRYFI